MNNNVDIDKKNFGIVYTPDKLVDEILDLIPQKYLENPNLKWLDIGAGKGAFSKNLYNRLIKNLSKLFNDDNECKKHILKNMLYMVEIYEPHIEYLQSLFGKESNIIKQSFLSINEYNIHKFDFIIGNPPYNINGGIKTPTNSKIKKTDDGKAIYVEFINKSLKILNKKGFLNLIIPSLWLKPDKAGLYDTLTNLNIHKLKCLSTTDSCKAFNYEAQTPTCFFLIENIELTKTETFSIEIYDRIENKYIDYQLKINSPIPINGIQIINKLNHYLDLYGTINYIKTSTPPQKMIIKDISEENLFINIKTCLLDKLTPNIVYNYSNIKSKYSNNKPKLIMANKMYGIPFFDKKGNYGISTRDNYLIQDYSLTELQDIQLFLSSKFALFIFSICNYRMRYLEKYAFSFIPDITKISDFPKLLNVDREKRDELIANFFNLSNKEKEFIEKSFKDYQFFI